MRNSFPAIKGELAKSPLPQEGVLNEDEVESYLESEWEAWLDSTWVVHDRAVRREIIDHSERKPA